MKAKPPLEMAGWREAHIGFEDDGLKIDGVEVWKQKWRSPDRQSVQLPHPAHPQQLHRYVIHEVGDAGHPLRFAACELSNGVWGFFVPMEQPAAAPQAAANTSATRGHGASIEVTPRHPLAAWRTALAMLVGALVVMAVVAFWAMHYASATPQKLDTVPAMSQ